MSDQEITKKESFLSFATKSEVSYVGDIKSSLLQANHGKWLLCDGSAVSRTTYATLFALLGTTFGSGDGSSTFNLPDGQALFLRGSGSQTSGGITYTGPSLGQIQADASQGHWHNIDKGPAGADANSVTTSAFWTSTGNGVSDVSATKVVKSPITDGSNGTPRTANETRPINLGVNFFIRGI